MFHLGVDRLAPDSQRMRATCVTLRPNAAAPSRATTARSDLCADAVTQRPHRDATRMRSAPGVNRPSRINRVAVSSELFQPP